MLATSGDVVPSANAGNKKIDATTVKTHVGQVSTSGREILPTI
jgi:hypothetical protein